MKGFIALSPFIVFLLFYIGSSTIAGDFASTPIVIAFLFASVYAIATTPHLSLKDRIKVFTSGAGEQNLIFMILIFVFAGAFAATAEATGCVSDSVNFILSIVPARFAFAGIFVAGAFLSFGTGSGIGTIVAIGPIAVGIGNALGLDMPMTCAVIVCGAMFGDNLSFISDTTIVATASQNCRPDDKFKVNIKVALPAAIAVTILYMYLGDTELITVSAGSYKWINILPYLIVILLSIFGVNVLLTLLIGACLCGGIGISLGIFDFYGWMGSMSKGIEGMSPFITIIILASGLISIIQYNGGIKYVVEKCTALVRGTRSAEVCICLLTGVVCACTANNTVAIMSVGDIVRNIADKFGVDRRKSTFLLDTSSCIVQEILPYSTHLLAAAAFGHVSTMEMLPYVYYAYLLIVCVAFSIFFRLPRFRTN